MNVGRREKPDPAVAMLRVVPGEEPGEEGPGILERAEAVRERGPVLEGPDLGFAERVVVTHVGPGMAPLDPEVGEQEGNGLAAHRRAPVGVDRELTRDDALLLDGLRDQALGEEALSRVATIQPGT